MREIIGEERKKFSDEEVKELIEEYIECNGIFSEFYTMVYDLKIGEGNEKSEIYLDMIPKAITKYIFDNVVEFIEYCDNRQVRLINDIRKIFAKEVEFAMMKIDRLTEDSDERKRYEVEKHAYERYINLGQIGYGIHIVVVKELIIPLTQFMEENFQRVMPEMLTNYKIVCQAHGISEQDIGDVQENEEENEKTLEELEQELQKLQKQEKRTTRQRDESKLLRNAYKAELDKEAEY